MPSPLVDAGLLPWADIPYDETLARKLAFVKGAFDRRGLRAEVSSVEPSPRTTGARARVKFQVEGGQLGFYRLGTHDFVRPSLDELARPEIVAAASAIRPTAGEVELRSDGERVVVDATAPVRGLPDVAIKGRPVAGNPNLLIDGLRASPGTFFQVNLEVNRALVALVDQWLRDERAEALLDLYGGIGNLSRAARARGTPVTLVESNPASVADAKHNLPGASVQRGDAGRFQSGSVVFDVALLDPPRQGAPGVLTRIATTRPRAIVYVSCDPVTLARDVAELGDAYEIAQLVPFDMFPGTDHVESACLLRRVTRTGRPVQSSRATRTSRR